MIHVRGVKDGELFLLENITRNKSHDWKESNMLGQADMKNW
jgi:hypothetical protein